MNYLQTRLAHLREQAAQIQARITTSFNENKLVIQTREQIQAFLVRNEIPIRLLNELRPVWFVLIFSTLIRFFNQVIGIAILTRAAWGIGQAVLMPESDVLGHTMVELVVLGVIKGILRYLEYYTGYYVTLHLPSRLRADLYERLRLLAPAGLLQTRTGDIVSRATADIDRIETFYRQSIAPAVVGVLVPIVTVVAMAQFSIWLALVFVPFLVAVGIFVPRLMPAQSQQDSLRERQLAAEVNAHAVDSIQGLREIVVTGNQEQRRKEISERTERLNSVQERLALLAGRQNALTDLLISGCVLVVLGLGLWLVSLGSLEIVAVPATIALVITSFGPIMGIGNVVEAYRATMASAARIFELIDQTPVVQDLVDEPPAETVEPSITFSGVFFRYPTSDAANNDPAHGVAPWIHNDLSFTVPAGRTVALVGSSGSGKSTVVNLLLRFWDVQEGQVQVGGYNVSAFPLEDLRSRIAVVAQNTYIFNTTIKENLLLGSPAATEIEIEQAARQANIHDFIIGLPDGYQTRVGEMGTRLSGGQRQRLAIARALLKDAPILVLDEATSNLDAANEREIQTTIQHLMEGRTTLVIAHRLSTVVNADNILVIDQGHIVEQGTHKELLAGQGVYARLFARQQDESEHLLVQEL